MVKIRLTRVGAKKRPYYRIVVMDERRQRDGRALEFLGTYDPLPKIERLDVNIDRVDAWLAEGAQLSDTVKSLVGRARKQAATSAAAAGTATEGAS